MIDIIKNNMHCRVDFSSQWGYNSFVKKLYKAYVHKAKPPEVQLWGFSFGLTALAYSIQPLANQICNCIRYDRID